MLINQELLNLINNLLNEKGKPSSKGNYIYTCIKCNHHKRKLEINLDEESPNYKKFACWICGFKSKNVVKLFKEKDTPQSILKRVNEICNGKNVSKQTTNNEPTQIKLPKEFIPLTNILSLDKLTQIEAKHALKFLYKRNLNKNDVIKYNIGFCKDGKYKQRIIIPSYDENGLLNYFIARDYTNNQPQKYKNPPVDVKSVIGWELYINWDAPVILVEGMFDAICIRRNVIPLFGKVIHEKLMKKLVSSNVNKIYIILDPDAIKNSLKYCEELMTYNKEIYLVELNGKDASEVGYKSFLETIESAKPLTFQNLIFKKINL